MGAFKGSTAKKNQQQKIQALTEQLEAQRRALEQLIEDFCRLWPHSWRSCGHRTAGILN